mgnify:CR=1 FL=1
MQELDRYWKNLPEARRTFIVRAMGVVAWGASLAGAAVFGAYEDDRKSWIVAHGDAVTSWVVGYLPWIITTAVLGITSVYALFSLRILRAHVKEDARLAGEHETQRVNEEAEKETAMLASWTAEASLRVRPAVGWLIKPDSEGILTIDITVENIGPKQLPVEKLSFSGVQIVGCSGRVKVVNVYPHTARPLPFAQDSATFSIKIELPKEALELPSGLLELSGGKLEVYDGPPPSRTYYVAKNLYASVLLKP